MNSTSSISAPLLMDSLATSKALGISPRTLWSMTKAGEIAHVRAGRRVLYDPRDLSAWIDRNKSGGEARS